MKKIFILGLLCSSLTLSAQQSALLEKYRSMALGYNHDLKAAERNISASIELENMARADMKPSLTGGANFNYTGNPLELTLNMPGMDNPVSFQGKDLKYGASVTLLQPVYTGGRLLESIRMAQHQQSLASSQAEMIGSAVCFQTDMQYWNTVARREMVDIASDSKNSVSSLVTTIRERVEAGLVDPQDLLMAEVKLNEAEYQLLQAQSNFETGRMALNSIIGEELQQATPTDSCIPVVSLQDSLLHQEEFNRPELKIAYDKIKIEESTLKLNDSQYKPQLYIGIDGSYSSPGYNFRSDLDPNYAVYAKLSIPIFEWGKRKSQKRASTHRIEMATDNLNKVTDNIRLEVQTARTALLQAIRRIELAGSSLEKARENEQKATERYAEGKVSILEVIDAQTYRQTAQVNYVQAKVSAQGHYSELIKSLNLYEYK
ncbi:TolC family protein [uncultured Parabacteroides sp.]|uniref:TolC family protein n=1 Tax=uncultured Parabacteroides sp. TaxID=512312 RepID=UPI0025DE0421|nr:TolC family protein [uncultured Parabacteroides sp.]